MARTPVRYVLHTIYSRSSNCVDSVYAEFEMSGFSDSCCSVTAIVHKQNIDL